jgi:hypothetical protein
MILNIGAGWMMLYIVITTVNTSMAQTTTYEYADGSGNRYLISESSLEYVPVKKEESSTGMYSGGEPRLVPISSATFGTLRQLLENAWSKKEVHIADRIKTSGAITRIADNKHGTIILRPGCAEITAIENALKNSLK